MSHRDIVKAQLIEDEGLRLKPYRDSVGKLTLGVGRNLDDKGISRQEAFLMLDNDINDAEKDAAVLFGNFDTLTENRRAVLVNMAFNLGRKRLEQFNRFRAAVESCDFETAAREALMSRWADQVGPRAQRLAQLMRDG